MSKLAVVATVLFLCTAHSAYAGGPWSEQYCNITTETVVVKDKNGNVTDSNTVEVMVCDDGAKDFLAYSGIAKSCEEYKYTINLRGNPTQRKGYACQKNDGTWEVVNYPSTNR